MRIALIVIMCGCLVGCDASEPDEVTSVPLASVGSQTEESFDQARLDELAAAYSAGDIEAVIPQLEKFVAIYPHANEAWTILGNAYRDNQQMAKALQAYRSALEADPSSVAAHTGMGILYRKRGEYRLAMDAYQRALKLEPDNAETYSSMMVIAWKMDRNDVALRFAQKGYELNKTDPVIASNLAMAYHMNEQYDERDRMVQIAEQLGSKDIERMKQIFSGNLSQGTGVRGQETGARRQEPARESTTQPLP